MLDVTTALILVDIQNDYFPNGRMELHRTEAAAQNARLVLEHFRTFGRPIVHIRHVALDDDATFFLPETDGVEIHHLVAPLEGEDIVTKHTPNAFVGTDLAAKLASYDVDDVVIVGMMTHMCIDSTTRAASDLGFSCTVVADACATRAQTLGDVTVDAPAVHAAFLAALSGTFADVRTAVEIVG